jgi:ATP-dependent Lhr-like helicase
MKSAFDLFAAPLRKAIDERGFKSPTQPQSKTIPHILKRENVLLIAPTGTGKTEAAFLPLIHFLITSPKDEGIKALYITPLRALNRDMLERMVWWCKKLDLRLGVRHGDTSERERTAQAKAPPDILITTPETLQAIIPAKLIRKHLKKVKWVIVDEVHELAVDKRGCQLSIGLERLRRLAGDFQVIGLSATIGTPERVGKFLVGKGRECVIVKVPVARFMKLSILFPSPKKEDYDIATKLYTFPEVASRVRLIKELVKAHNSTLIFTNTRSTAEILASRFRVWDINFPLAVHHGSLSKPSRIDAEKNLKDGKIKGIVCTSSLELGIDIGTLDLVIQYNSPRQVTRLLQRVGRSGHKVGAVAKGVVITQDPDDFLESAVICRRALKEDLEPVSIPDKPLDVLCHQLAGLLLERYKWSIEDAIDIVRNAYPYENLEEEDMVRVLEYMNSRVPRLAFFSKEDRVFMRPRNIKELYKYYFETLSMIPEEKQFLVIEEDSDKPIGLLDEAFVSEYGEIGVKFIERGSAWKILHIYKDRIYVKEEEDPAGAIPSWVGEEIPVPFEIAQEVGRLRRKIGEDIKVLKEYPGIKDESKGIKEIIEQTNANLPIPSDALITVETWKGFLIINCCFGLLVNKTIARALGHLISQDMGMSVGVQQDPYRIIIRAKISAHEGKKYLLDLAKKDIKEFGKEALVKTHAFKRRLVHVARKFGALEKEADVSTIKLSKLVDAFKGTAIYDEALATALQKDADLEKSALVLKRIASGDIQIVIGEITPISRIGIDEIGKYDIISPERMENILIKYTKARLLNEAKVIACIDCWSFVLAQKVKDLPDKISCPKCDSSRIAVIDDEEKIKIGVSKLPLEYKKSAELVSKYGRLAVLVLAGKNIRVKNAEKILKKKETGEDLIRSIIEEEKNALKRIFTRST